MPLQLVGRADELGELARAWDRVPASAAAMHGGPETVVITGAGGVGKSRLIGAAIETISTGGQPITVLSASARLHSPAPYDWLAGLLSQHAHADLPVPAEALAWLAQEPDVPRHRYAPDALLRIAVKTVRALVGAGPAVIVVDDLHALDPASLNLVAELATVPQLPALLLVAGRAATDATSPELVRRVLGRLSGGIHARRLHVGPLCPSDVGAALAQLYPGRPDEVAAATPVAYEQTGGNPYRLIELVATTDLATLAPPATSIADGPPSPRRMADLTARELDVLACLASGMSNKEVARSLGISIRTVGVHVSSLLRKTSSTSRTDAALWAVRSRVLVGR